MTDGELKELLRDVFDWLQRPDNNYPHVAAFLRAAMGGGAPKWHSIVPIREIPADVSATMRAMGYIELQGEKQRRAMKLLTFHYLTYGTNSDKAGAMEMRPSDYSIMLSYGHDLLRLWIASQLTY